jgi:hypothetical protein
MLKPKKGFVMAQLNIEKLTPLQWDGIMRAMDAYAEHYHECKVNELSKGVVSGSLQDRLFELANDFAVAKKGEVAVKLHIIRNGLQ